MALKLRKLSKTFQMKVLYYLALVIRYNVLKPDQKRDFLADYTKIS